MKKENIKRITVLVTGIGSGGAGEGVVKSLNMVKGKYRIIGTDMNSLSAMTFRVDAGYKIPKCTDTSYFDRLNKICKDEKVEVLIPGSDAEMDVISNNLEKIDKRIFVLAHPKETVNICRDVWNTYLFLKKNKFYTPESYIPEEPRNLKFPLIVKDRFGGGSKNIFVVEDKKELDYALNALKKKNLKPIVQEYVGNINEEYTTGVLFSKERKLISSVTFKRTLLAGASGTMICKEFKEINEYAVKIASKLNTIGSINLQSRLVDGKPYIFEINPRFSGSSPARAGLGVNEVDLAIESYYLNKKVDEIKPKTNTIVMRCFQEIYSDLDELEKLEKGDNVKRSGNAYDYI